MARFLIWVESKEHASDTLDEALSVFSGMMWVNKDLVRKELIENGESTQAYGFCSGYVRDTQFIKSA